MIGILNQHIFTCRRVAVKIGILNQHIFKNESYAQ